MNAEVKAGGEVVVEVVDAGSLNPLPGWSAGDCQPLCEDHLAGEVRWGSSGTRPPLGDTPVRLRFYLRKASLYSFWLS